MKKRRITALILSALMLLCTAVPVFADEDGEEASGETEETYNTDASENGDTIYMEDDSLAPPEITGSRAAILIDADTGRLLYGKNIDAKLYPASMTKMMTAILAIESGRLDEVVTVPYEAIQSVNFLEDSAMGLLTGEELTLDQLVSSMLVVSANDAANVIAYYLGGSMDAFVEQMNQKAAELGMTNTHFANSNGLHDDAHVTTCRDLALISCEAIKNPTFRKIVGTVRYTITTTPRRAIWQRSRNIAWVMKNSAKP